MTVEVLIRAEAAPKVQRGAVLAVKPEGHQWGSAEMTARFARLTIIGATLADIEPYLAVVMNETGDDVIQFRRFRLSDLSVKQIEQNGGHRTIALTTLQSAALDDAP